MRKKAYKKKPKRIFKRKGKRRYRPMDRQNNKVVLGIGMPKSLIETFKITSAFSLTNTSGATATQTIQANFPYRITGGAGSSPPWWTTLSGFYQNWMVVGAKATCVWTAPQVAGGTYPIKDACVVGGYLGTTVNPSYTTVQSLCSQPSSVFRVMNPALTGTLRTTHYYSSKKYWGTKYAAANPTLYGQGSSTGPSEECYFNLFSAPLTATTDTLQQEALVTIEFVVKFFSPIEQIAST